MAAPLAAAAAPIAKKLIVDAAIGMVISKVTGAIGGAASKATSAAKEGESSPQEKAPSTVSKVKDAGGQMASKAQDFQGQIQTQMSQAIQHTQASVDVANMGRFGGFPSAPAHSAPHFQPRFDAPSHNNTI